jgi:hypothetical protein
MRTLHALQPHTILRATVGSTVHGLHLEGQEDRDEMAVAVEPPELLIGLARAKFESDGQYQQGFEHHVERTKPDGVKSGPGDLDRTTYSLRKWMRLACQGNPTTLTLLFVPFSHCDIVTFAGEDLRKMAPAIVSKHAGPRYAGYMKAQYERLIGVRGQKRTKRPALEEMHGYDTKYAMHVLRLAMQGCELMRTGRLTLPMPEGQRDLCLEVRRGEFSKSRTLLLIESWSERLDAEIEASRLADEPQWGRINSWLVRTYRHTWGWE